MRRIFRESFLKERVLELSGELLEKGAAPAGLAPPLRALGGPRENVVFKNPLFKDFCRALAGKLAAGGIRVLPVKSQFVYNKKTAADAAVF